MRGRARQAFVVGEVALTLVLLIAAGLMVRSFVRLSQLDLGFDPVNVLTFQLGGPSSKYETLDQDALTSALLSRYERTPGVVAAGAVSERPFEHGPIGMDSTFLVEGQTERQAAEANPILNWESVTPGYFRAMGIALIRGRLFDERDSEKAPHAVIVSENLAARTWAGQDPIGRLLRAYGGKGEEWQTVVGVVETARYREIDTPRFDLYLPHRQAPGSPGYFVVRTADAPTKLTSVLRHETAAVDPDLTLDGVTTMARIVARTQGPWRFNMMVFGAFGAVALLLAAMGLFSLVAYTVSQRTREIGVRMAVGATQRDVVGLMLGQGARLASIGLAAGLVASLLVTRLVSGLLFGVTATDPVTFAAVSAGLLAVSLLASYLPARRAARVDPLIALRVD